MSKLPFVLEKRNGTTLIKQLVDGFRNAIEIGIYRPGDRLPPFREVARESGACMIVVREAFKRLAAEGLVNPRRGVGSIVLESDVKFWRGHIVIASLEVRENHLISAMTGALRQALMKAGYLVSFVPFGSESNNYDFTHLETVLRNSVTMVVATSIPSKLESLLVRHKVPFIAFGQSDRAKGCVQLDCSSAVAAFVNHCRKAKVKKVIEVTVGSTNAQVSDKLRDEGIACEKWAIVRKGGIEEIVRGTLKAFYDRIEKSGRKWLPDVIYFNDNFASQNALLAMLESGLDIPGDVGFVTWSNAGEGPFWRKPLTRIEIDPFETGRVFAKYVLDYLNGKKIKGNAKISPRYIPGETF
jgi:DNA-binding LacI/PurR family transcriptional regulator